MPNDDEGDDLIEMFGRIVGWNGRAGFVQTDCGLRLPMGRPLLTTLGFCGPVTNGDRVHFYASKHVEVTYHIEGVRLIIPAASGPKPAERRSPRRRNEPPAAVGHIVTGTVETFDSEKGYGYVKTSCGRKILLHITCLRASGYRAAPFGMNLTFEVIQRSKGWQAIRVLPKVPR